MSATPNVYLLSELREHSSAPRQAPTRRQLGRWGRRALVAVSIGSLVRIGIGHLPEIRHAGGLLLTGNRWLIALTLALEVVWTVSLANVYRSAVIALGGGVDRREALRLSMGAFSLSRILPGGGAAGSIFAARALISLGNSVPLTVGSMAIAWWTSMVALAAIVGTGTAIGWRDGYVGSAYLFGPLVVLAVLVAGGVGVLAALRNQRLRPRIVSALVRLGSRLRVGASPAAWAAAEPGAARRRGRFLALPAWAAVSWLADAAALWVMFLAFGVRLHPGVLLVGYGLANLINALPELTPGWLGVLETVLSVAYAGLGVPAGTAVVAVLSYRLVSYWLPVAAGAVPALRMLRNSPSSVPPVADDHKAAA